jgi:hypothetical protein
LSQATFQYDAEVFDAESFLLKSQYYSFEGGDQFLDTCETNSLICEYLEEHHLWQAWKLVPFLFSNSDLSNEHPSRHIFNFDGNKPSESSLTFEQPSVRNSHPRETQIGPSQGSSVKFVSESQLKEDLEPFPGMVSNCSKSNIISQCTPDPKSILFSDSPAHDTFTSPPPATQTTTSRNQNDYGFLSWSSRDELFLELLKQFSEDGDVQFCCTLYLLLRDCDWVKETISEELVEEWFLAYIGSDLISVITASLRYVTVSGVEVIYEQNP